MGTNVWVTGKCNFFMHKMRILLFKYSSFSDPNLVLGKFALMFINCEENNKYALENRLKNI